MSAISAKLAQDLDAINTAMSAVYNTLDNKDAAVQNEVRPQSLLAPFFFFVLACLCPHLAWQGAPQATSSQGSWRPLG